MAWREWWFPRKRREKLLPREVPRKPLPREVPKIPLERVRSLLPIVSSLALGVGSVALIVQLPRYFEA